MKTPGFTAEASLYKTTAEYHIRTARQGRWTGDMGDNKGRIVPQLTPRCQLYLDICAEGNRVGCWAYLAYC